MSLRMPGRVSARSEYPLVPHLLRAAKSFVLCALLLAAPSALSQNYPMPGSSTAPPVICTTCPAYPNFPTWPYTSPPLEFAGRYIDSQLTRDYQANFGMRTLRAGRVEVVPAHNRVYMIIGSTFASYDLGTFFTQKLGQSLSPNNYIASTWREGNPAETHLRWNAHVYPEGPNSGWLTSIVDIQHLLYDFDTDDRNLVYLAYSAFGWGIVRNEADASLSLVSQTFEPPGVSPTQILSVKSGSSYYAIVSAGGDTSLVYDVTNPAQPVLVRVLGFGVVSWDKTASHVALVTAGKVRIYTVSALVSGGSALIEFAPTAGTFQMVASDGQSNFFAVENHNNSNLRFSIFRLSGSSFSETKHSNGERFIGLGLRYGSGHLSIWGYDSTFKSDTRLFKLNDLVPSEIALSSYFRNYYTAAPAGYAQPAGYTTGINDVVVHNYGGRNFLFHSNHGLGDVYELNPSETPAPTPRRPADFLGTGVSQSVVYRDGAWMFFSSPSMGIWTGQPSQNCIPAPGDYNGDGIAEFSMLCNGAWHFYNSNGSYLKGIWTGNLAGDLPVPADYDGDGDDDVVVFRNNGAWLFYDYTTGAYVRGVWTGGGAGSIPVPGDYDGDGMAEFSVYARGPWHFFNADGSYRKGIWTGVDPRDIPVPGDYAVDGRDQVVIFRAGAWLFYDFETRLYTHGVWTGPGAVNGASLQPAPLDIDGDGTVEFTVKAGGPWHFYNDNGSYIHGVWTGVNANDQAISRRQHTNP